MTLYNGDCLEVMRGLPANSVDLVLTDPPYGLRFMGKKWDYDVPTVDVWRECLRVLKPGGHCLAFAGTRTQHRMAVNIEEAGFEIRDMLAWLYGSGFPKSHNGAWGGTALKPAHEPITMARKPLDGTVAANVAKYGTGGLDIDGCRVGHSEPCKMMKESRANIEKPSEKHRQAGRRKPVLELKPAGRWPANVIHDGSEEVRAVFPETKTGNVGMYQRKNRNGYSGAMPEKNTAFHNGDSGSAARFFYCAKASKKERDAGLEGMPEIHRANGNKWTDEDYRVKRGERPPSAESGPRRNHHPTVKPIALIEYLCKLASRPAAVVLDPFMGSGTTGVACKNLQREFIGIELDPEYFKIAEQRIQHAAQQLEIAT